MSQVNNPENAQNYLQMPYNQFVCLRKEFMDLCGDRDEAMILRIIEYEIEGDRRIWLRSATACIEQGEAVPKEPEWWVALSHKQIRARLYDSVRDEKTLRVKLRSLIEKQYLKIRDNPNNHHGSPQYTINKPLVQEKLNALPPLPTIAGAALSQSNPLPKLVPPAKIGTPCQNWQEGGTKIGRREVPKSAGGRYQNRQEGGTKIGRTNKKRENSQEFEEGEREESELQHGQTASDSLSLSSNSHKEDAGSALVSHPEHHSGGTEPSAQNPDELPSLQPVDFPIAVKERESGGIAQPDAPDSHGYRKGGNQDGQIPREEVPHDSNPLIAMLTEEQATFWLRWCAVSKIRHDRLNQTAYNHITEWSDEVKTQEDLQDLYDIADKRIRALCAANNQPYVPPRLGNLKNARGDWQAACKQREDQIRGHFVPGSGGQKRNLTYELMEKRKRGESIEPIIYQPAPVVTPKRRHWVTGEVVTTECSPEELTWQCETCGLQPPIALSGQRWVRRTCRCERHARVFTPGTTTQVGTISAEDFTLQRQQFSQRVAPGAT